MQSELDTALAHQKAARLDEAEKIYRRVLASDPQHPQALHWLGVLALQRGDPKTAAVLIRRALEIEPNYLQAHSNLGLALQAQGRLDEAVSAYEHALSVAPDDTDLRINLALALQARGRTTEAIAALRRTPTPEQHPEAHRLLAELQAQQGDLPATVSEQRDALASQPESAAAQYNLGRAHQLRGDLRAAIEAYERALALDPHLAPAHNNLGAALAAQGRLAEAVAAYRQAIALKPQYADAHNNLGLAYQSQGRPAAAEAAFSRSLELNDADADVHSNLGLALATQGKLEPAVTAFNKALALDPKLAAAHSNLGHVHAARGDTAMAILSYQRALALKPDHADAYNNLGNILLEEGRLTDAVAAYDKALALRPDFAQTYSNRSAALLRQGQHERAVAGFRHAMALDPGYAQGHSNLLQAMHYSPGFSADTIFTEARRWQRQHAERFAAEWRPHENTEDPERRLRIGYVSADFRRHPVGWFFLPVLEHHDKSRFELFCYASVNRTDEFTQAFKAHASCWREVLGLNDADLAAQIRSDGIDILVDLSGHARGQRLLVFARRPAPVQVTAGGHYDTTGMDAMDYLIADRFHAPPGSECYFSEALIRMPDDYVCYRLPTDAPPVSTLPALENAYVTFGCFNNLAKLNTEVIALWASILTALPTSRLWLQTRELNDAPTVERYQALLARHDADPSRLVLRGGVPHDELLAAYGEIDIALDPFPYSGGLTTLEALWMGVPVITLTGQNFCGRHSTSHLANVGLPEFVTSSTEEYARAALALAQDPERLRNLRSGLRERMAASPLCDARAYTRDLETAYREMWERYCAANIS